jgi:hypothetical protein
MAHHLGNTNNERVADIIESRSPAGRNDAVVGWHNLLKDLLLQMAPYLRPGRLVTFRELKAPERLFFEIHLQVIKVPDSVEALYLPPSVRHQMLYQRPAGEPQPIPEHPAGDAPDDGIVLACREDHTDIVINALFAKPPFAPAIDVYDDGQLLAGYVYQSIHECIADLSKVLQTHLQPGGRQRE